MVLRRKKAGGEVKMREGGGDCGGIPSQKARCEEMSERSHRRDSLSSCFWALGQ